MDPIYHALKTHLATVVQEHHPQCLIVGLSGGVDSVVLLHALSVVQRCEPNLPEISAVYINHGLSPNADLWQQFCSTFCESVRVPFTAYPVDVSPGPRESLEACAREQRYAALTRHAKSANGAILTAHHQDDQLETVLLQLKRGAGPKGLSGIPAISTMHSVILSRPLLAISREQIVAYARQHSLRWIEDESNMDDSFDRNFLRQQIIPSLSARWPAVGQTVSRSAGLCAEQQALLDEVCDDHLNNGLCYQPDRISVTQLKSFSARWQRALLRRWLERNQVAMPGTKQLEQIQYMLRAKPDAQPHLVLGRVELRRYQNELHCLHKRVSDWSFESLEFNVGEDVRIAPVGQRLSIRHQANDATLVLNTAVSHSEFLLQRPVLSVALKPAGAAHHKPLKQWLKQWNIPPWERSEWLLLSAAQQPLVLISKEKVTPLSNAGQYSLYIRLRPL